MMKKFFASFLATCIFSINGMVFAATPSCRVEKSEERVIAQEHLDINKKAPNNVVTITNCRKIVNANNVVAIAFESKFFSKKAAAGDIVNFVIPESIYTKEGTLIIPAQTKVVGEIIKMQHPKWFNKNARVTFIFRHLILPDGRVVQLNAQAFTKDGTLKEGPWMTTGRIVLSTVSFGILGAGAGAGFGFIPSPTHIGVGLAAGIPAGCGVGLLVALITKGLHYKAKAGEQVFIILTDDASIDN